MILTAVVAPEILTAVVTLTLVLETATQLHTTLLNAADAHTQ